MAEYVDYPLVAPLDEGKDERSLDATPRLRTAKNARVRPGHDGQLSVRPGTEDARPYVWTLTNSMTWPARIWEQDGVLTVIDDGWLHQMVSGYWTRRCEVPRLRIGRHRNVFGGDPRANPQADDVSRGVGVGSAATAAAGGVVVTAYHVAADRFTPVGGEGEVRVHITRDGVEVTGPTVFVEAVPAGAPQPHIEVASIVSGDDAYFLIAWGSLDSGDWCLRGAMLYVDLSETGYTLSPPYDLVPAVDSGTLTPTYDNWSLSSNGVARFFLAVAHTNSNDVRLMIIPPSGAPTVEDFTVTASGAHRHVAVAFIPDGDEVHVWVAENFDTDVSLAVRDAVSGVDVTSYNIALSSLTGQVGITAVSIGNSESMCLINRVPSVTSAAGCTILVGSWQSISGVYPDNGAENDVYPFRVSSRPWLYGDSIYCLVTGGASSADANPVRAPLTLGYAVIRISLDMSRWSSSDPYAIVDSGTAPQVLYSQGDVPVAHVVPVGVGVDSDGVVWMPVVRRKGIPVGDRNSYAGLGLELVALVADRKRYSVARLGGKMYIAAGALMCHDGARAYEVGYSHLPHLWSGRIQDGTDGSLAGGEYLVGWGWEWVDRHGDACASAVQVATITLDAGSGEDEIVLTFEQPPFPLSLKGFQSREQRQVQLVTYLSEPDGTTLYRNISYPLPAGTFGEHSISLTEVYPDAEVCPYTDAGRGELQPFPPPPCTVICAHQGRLYVVPDNDPVRIWYSKPQQPGRALEFSPQLTIYVGDRVTSLASSGGNLVVFTARDTYAIAVQPADERGVGAGPNEPLLVTAGRGCTDHRATISTPVGVFYRGADGLMLLPRGGIDPVAMGNIDRTLAAYPDVADAVQIPDAESVALVLLDDAESNAADGVVAVFDYAVGQWFIWQFPATIHALTVYKRKLALAKYTQPNGDSDPVKLEADSFVDWEGSFIPVEIETEDIRVGGAAGYARVSRATLLGERLGPCSVSIAESVDSGDTYATAATFELDNNNESEVYLRKTFIKQKATRTRVKLTITELGRASDSEGCALNAIKLEVQPIRGAVRLPAGRRG